MNDKAYLQRAHAWGLIAFICFAVMIILIERGRTAVFDGSVMSWIQSFESDKLTWMMESFSSIGGTKLVILLTIGVALFLALVLRHRYELILLIAVVGGSAVMNVILKNVFRRDRPNLYRLIEETGYGFPSGHSVGAVALYGVVTYLLWNHASNKRWKAALISIGIIMVLGIGISRIYLGVHYPSDVIGGYLVSGAWMAICIELFKVNNKLKTR